MATGTAPSGAAIASAARQYAGQGYVYGGTGARPGDWDCSSFASYVLGHDLGIGLPGGTWAQVTAGGTVHGPVVLSYATWGGAITVPAASMAAGDLVVWPGLGTGGHMGIVQGYNQMVSALDSAQGTLISPVQGYGPAGVTPVFRRVTAAATSPVPGVPGVAGTGWGGTALAMLAGLGIGAAMLVAVLALAAGAAAGAVWLAGKAAREAL